ncbi:MAG: hypothetical protein JRI23_25345, partial [Deltaproteobacteria bacterium]|nr:hypothetical protein [Deltaproteobacteria bacterium]MBW2535344.1 hypothetical protein [Deltaproteobacteria bacterium]
GGGSGATGPCGTLGVYADDFADGVNEAGWYVGSSGGATIGESNGELVITLPNQGSSWSGWSSWYLTDLRSDRVSLEVPTMANVNTDATVFLHLILDSDNFLILSQQAGTLYFTAFLSNAWTQFGSTTYDPTAHRFWQIREQGGTVYWETSSDGATYVEGASAPVASLFDVDAVQLEFGASTSGTETNPGEVHFDNLNGGPPARASWCPTSTLVDDFDDGLRTRDWWNSYEGGGCDFDETGGEIVFTLSGSAIIDCAYLSGSAFDLTESSVSVETGSMPTSEPNAYTFFSVQVDSDNAVEFVVDGDQLITRAEVAGNWQHAQSVLFSTTDHRFLRIREQGGTVYWETSADGASWTPRNQAPTPIPLTKLQIVLGAGKSATGPVNGTAAFDNLNVLP